MKITKWYNSDVVFESTKETFKEAVVEAVELHANLRDADLGGANLGGADLRDANLRGANLGGANLYHVNFFGRGGKTKIKKSQVEEFHIALGIIVEE